MSPRALALLLLLSAIWGSSYMLIKVAVPTVPPVTVAAARIATGALVLVLVVWARGERLPASVAGWRPFVVMAVLGNALPFTLIAWGEVGVDSGLAAILMSFMPLSTVVLAHVFTADERFSADKAVGLALGFTGVVVLIGADALAGLGGAVVRQLAIIGATVCYAGSTVYARRLVATSPTVAAATTMVAATALMVPASLLIDAPWALAPSPEAWLALAILGVVGTAAGTLVYFALIRAGGATVTAMVNYLIPLMGVLWGAALLGERPPVRAYVALALILAGIAAINRRRALR